MKSLLNAFTKKEGKRRASLGRGVHGNKQLLTGVAGGGGSRGTPGPPKIAIHSFLPC